MNKVLLVMGTRPEVIKLAPVFLLMEKHPAFEPIILSSGQHREMLSQAFGAFSLHPEYDLELMTAAQELATLIAKVIKQTGQALERIRPDVVLVQGDTTTVLGASISAFYAQIPIGHVEAGLRTYDFSAPWPEEFNRRLVDPIAQWCFAPTDQNRSNLLAERIPEGCIHVTGNTVVDSLLLILDRISRQPETEQMHLKKCGISQEFAEYFLPLSKHTDDRGRFILVTGHRRESFGAKFENICKGILEVVKTFPDIGVIYPVHLNPKVQEPVRRLLGNNSRVQLIEPVDYETFVWLMSRAYFILTDSGGIQEEAPSLGKPVLVMRDRTERPEGVAVGTSRLVGTDPQRILEESSLLLSDPEEYQRRSQLKSPYGDGRSSERIVDILLKTLGG